MRVIGIDPAPSKGLAVFDGQDRLIPIAKSRSYITGLSKQSDVLVCWDAPLTGPGAAVISGAEGTDSTFSKRPIERFFSLTHTGFKTPTGISVLGYSGCSHWALTRSLIGLPKTGPYDQPNIPFNLVEVDLPRPEAGRHVAEVHPALALWLWCRYEAAPGALWDYKKDAQLRMQLWHTLLMNQQVAEALSAVRDLPPASDDEFDARIAYALGKMWLEAPGAIVLLGNLDVGTFLVPRVVAVEEAFARFLQSPRARQLARSSA